ncbi:MAG: hypothetical protein IPL32_06370 [Chloracidobacterium sp.]|nr:hypothetical protein [Chloracidobacterium sp.]
MNKKLQDGRFRIVSSLLAFCLLIGVVFSVSLRASSFDLFGADTARNADSGTLEKMIVGNGNVTMELDLNRLNGTGDSARMATLSFEAVQDTFFAILVLNGELRGPIPSSMEINPRGNANIPASLRASYRQLVIEYLAWGGDYEMAVRDKKTGFTYFNIEGQEWNFDANQRVLGIENARLLISPEFAAQLGRQADAGAVVGTLSANTSMRTVETVLMNDGEATQTSLPPMNRPDAGSVPGPDVVVGDLSGLAQFGSSSNGQVGLAVGTDSCNFGTIPLNWFANPSNDHPVIPQNIYRMSGGASNNERFEQIGQGSVKHAFTALQQNLCNLGCNSTGGTTLGSGCSDPYSASLNSGPSLGSKAWINPFTGAYPRNDSITPNNDHSGHSHTGPSHRILVNISDLNTTLNPGATYFAEAQYVTPHEYVWCQNNPGQCNMNNNASYRQYNVSGTTSFSFSAAGSTVRMQPAIQAWPGATHVTVEPERGIDGFARVSYKVTQTAPNVWHYEYAIYNQNLDRGIQSFRVPIGTGVNITNVGFYAPPQHPGWSGDGTAGSAGFASTPWTTTQTPGKIEWATQTALVNANANAIRWGTMYNFRFDADKPPATMYGTVGFFKTGAPGNVLIQGPRSSTPSPCARVISTSSNPCASAN